MTVEKINPAGLHVPQDNVYAHITRASGTTTYRVGGQVAVDAAGKDVAFGDMAGQIRCCYDMVDRALTAVGLDWSDVTHIYTFTTCMDEYLEQEQAIAREYFGDAPPASTLVEVSRLVKPEWLVEVQVDAVADS
jgi:enamine deaminase RidA (YjgF/YER057c/UK114 family)